MANPVKIYEVKTLGYNQLIDELNNIEAAFNRVKQAKKEANVNLTNASSKTEQDAEKQRLKDLQIEYLKLKQRRQELLNEAKAQQITQQEEINQKKTLKAQLDVESGSITDLINKRKQLKALIESTRPTSGTPITFAGSQLSYQEATAQFQAMGTQLNTLRTNLTGVQDIGTRVTGSLAAGFERLRGTLSNFVLTYIGWFAAFREAGALIKENIELSDSYANLQIRIHGTAAETEQLVEQLRKIDTRTSLKGLVDLANIISKKGVAKEDIAALTKEFDKLNVVLGQELGDPSTATANIIKLITVFNDDKQVTAQRVNEIATSLFKLTTSGVATGEFLVNFAERVGAIRGITGLTLPAIFGMGAALQQLGQRVELSSTSIVQLTTKVFADVPKFAEAAGKSVEEFRKTLAKNPFEALIQVAEGLKNLPTEEIGSKFEEVVQAFQDAGIVGVRIKAVLGDIATNGRFVQERMDKATVSTRDYADQSAAATLKQSTFAATVDRVRKAFELLGTQKGVQLFLAAVAAIILVVVNNLGLIIGVLGVYAAAWTVANSQMIAARVATIATNAVFVAQYAILQIQTTFLRAYSAALSLFTGATTRAAAATTLLGTAMKLIGIGALITLIAVLAAGCNTLVSKVNGSTEALRRQALQMQIANEINQRANEQVAEQISQIDSLARVVLSSVTSIDTKRIALDKLIGINNKFSDALKGNIIDLTRFKELLTQVKDQIELNARAEAAAGLAAEKYKNYLSVVSVRQIVETQIAANKGVIDTGFDKFAKGPIRDIFFQVLGEPTKEGDIVVSGITYSSKELFANLKKLETSAFDEYSAYNEASTNIQVQIGQKEEERQKTVDLTREQILRNRIAEAQSAKLTIDGLKSIIKSINEFRDNLREGDARLAEYEKFRDEFQARLDKLESNKTKRYRGAQLTGDEKDRLNEIDSEMKAELAIEEARYSKTQADHRVSFDEERQYVNNILSIQEKYLNQKIAYLNAQKSLNAREKEQRATFQKELADQELQAQQRLQSINDQEFNFKHRGLKEQLDEQIAIIQAGDKQVQEDQSLSATDRAQHKLDSDKQILALQEKFNKDVDALEKQLAQHSTENAKENARAIAKTTEDIIKDATNILNSQIKDVQDAEDEIDNEFKIRAAERTKAILNSGKSALEIARELKQLQNQLSIDLLNSKIAAERLELELYKQGLSKKLKSEKDYLEAKRKLAEDEAKLTETTVNKELSVWEKFEKALKDLGGSFLENVLKIKQYTKDAQGEEEKRADAVAESQRAIQQAISQAYQGFFDSERQKIEDAHQNSLDRLQLEEDQVKARATSQAEIDSIDRQYAAKRKALDKQEGEQKKQLALKELTIDYAIAVVRAIAQYGLPLALIPIAAETALYFVQRANIQAQKFARGGIAPTKTGGEITGPSHRDGGVKFEAQGHELMIVNKKSALDNTVYTVTGTGKQIASKINELGGGLAFSKGAIAQRKFEVGGLLGVNYRAPIFTPSNTNGQDNLALVLETRNMVVAVNDRIDRLEVIQDTNTVTTAQKKIVKQKSIGVL